MQQTYGSGGEPPRYYSPDFLNEVRVKLLEEGIPRHRGNVTVTQSILHNFGVLGRVNYYGPWYENAVGSQTYDGAYLVDLETNYTVDENMSITIGVQNALNVEPDTVTSSDPDVEDFTAKIVGRHFGEYSP